MAAARACIPAWKAADPTPTELRTTNHLDATEKVDCRFAGMTSAR